MRRIEWFEGLNGLGLAVIEGLNGLRTGRGAKDVECDGELMWSESGKVRGKGGVTSGEEGKVRGTSGRSDFGRRRKSLWNVRED